MNAPFTDAHLEDRKTCEELKAEEAAAEKRHDAVTERVNAIVKDESEIMQLIIEYPDDIARLILAIMVSDSEGAALAFRNGVRALAKESAESDTMCWESFLPSDHGMRK